MGSLSLRSLFLSALLPLVGCATVLGLDDLSTSAAGGAAPGGGSAGTAGHDGGGGTGGSGGGAGGVAGAGGQGPVTWSRRLGGSGLNSVAALGVGPDGRVVVGGAFEQSIDLGWGALSSTGGADLFIGAFDSEGGPLWEFTAASSNLSNDAVHDLIVLDNNHVVFVAIARDSLALASPCDGTNAVPAGTDPLRADILVAELDADGACLWSRRLEGEFPYWPAHRIARRSDGSLLLSGSFDTHATVDGGPLDLDTSDGVDAFLAELSPAGVPTWAHNFGGDIGAAQAAWDVAEGPNGLPVIVGEHNGPFTQGMVLGHSAGASLDLFIAQMQSTGSSATWSLPAGDTTDQKTLGVAVADDNRVLVAGYFEGSINLDGHNHTAEDEADVFVAAFSAGGARMWSHAFGNTDAQWAWDLEIDDSQNRIGVVGYSKGDVDFGGGLRAGLGEGDVFVVVLDGDGEHRASALYGDSAEQSGIQLAFAPTGEIVVAGNYHGSFTIGGELVGLADGRDIFVAKLPPLLDSP